jgi:hypothetical protein
MVDSSHVMPSVQLGAFNECCGITEGSILLINRDY